MLDVLILVLDILVASSLAAILTRFATGERFVRSIQGITRNHQRFAQGVLLFLPSLVFSLPGLLLQGTASPDTLDAVNALGYPFSFLGAYLIYSSTSAPETPLAASEGSPW